MTPRKKDAARGGAPQDPLAELLRCVADLARLYDDYDLYCALRRLFLDRQVTAQARRISEAVNRIDANRNRR